MFYRDYRQFWHLRSAIFAALFCCALSTQAVAAAITPVERSDDELVLVDLRIDRTTVAEAVPGYSTKSGLLLPLGQLTDVLELALKVSPQEGQADGWILDPQNTLTLDVARGEAVLRGSTKKFPQGQVEPHKNDIYVDTALLSEWLQVDFDFSFANQSVTLKPREGVKLPVQQKVEREQARSTIGKTGFRGAVGPYPRKEIPYQLYTIPYTDLTYTGGYDKRAYSGLHNNLTALAEGDLFYMHSTIYGSARDSSDISDLRLTLSRRDPDGKILQSDDKLAHTKLGEALNEYEVREVKFGDINSQQLPLTAFNQQGRGAMISNIPYDRATQYDRTTLQGDLPSGWEVELYRNDELLSFQRASANGRYEFVDVPLLSGLNLVRLVFYGPFGQTREEVQRFLVTPEITRQGKSYFRVSATQQNTDSFDVLNQQQVNNLSGNTPDQLAAVKGKPRAVLEYEYGLLDNLSMFLSNANLTTTDGNAHSYVSGGLATSIAGTYGRVDVARDATDGGNAVKLLVQDRIGKVSLAAEHQQYFDFQSEYTELTNDSLIRNSTLRADAPLTLPYLPRLNNGVSISQFVYDSDRRVNEYTYRIGTSIRQLALSNNLTYRTDTTPIPTSAIGIGGIPITFTSESKQTNGDLLVSFPFRRLILRGNMLYTLAPQKELQTLLSAVEYNFSPQNNLSFQLDRQLIGQRLTIGTIGLNHIFEKFRLGGNISRDSEGQTRLGATLSLSFGEDPRTGNFQFYPEYSANNGLISARAYQDINGNDIFDDGDKPIENARFLVGRGGSQQRTDANGNLLLRNIQPDIRSSLTLDNASLDNPYLLSKVEGMDIVTRPGVAAIVDYPVTGSGDVEGTVRIIGVDSDEAKDATNVTMQILAPDGTLVRETQTSYDGYYLLSGIPAGDYTVRISPEQAVRLGFITPPARAITITNDEMDSRIFDFTIIRDPAGPAPAAPQDTPPPAPPPPAAILPEEEHEEYIGNGVSIP